MSGLLIVLLLLGLPVAVWLDLTNLAEANLRRQAIDLNSVISSVRSYYASNVVGRVLSSRAAHRGGAQLRKHPGRHPDPGHAVARARPRHQRAAAEHHLPLRLGLSVREPRAACARRIREGGAGCAARTARSADDQSIDRRLFTDTRAAGRAGDHGRGLRELPQHASGKPEAGLEGRRRPRHPGGDHHAEDRRRNIFSFKYLLAYFAFMAVVRRHASSASSGGRRQRSAA